MVPNHQTGRVTPIHTRSVVAMAGSFGYEMNLELLSEEEKQNVRQEIARFHQYWNVIHNGDYYRLAGSLESKPYAAWQFVTKDKREVLLNIVLLETHGNAPAQYIACKGLEAEALYKEEATGKVFYGNTLMHAGIPIPYEQGEYQAYQFYFTRV